MIPVAPFRILVSYHYFKAADLDATMARWFTEPYPEMFCDSGAFSAFSQGSTIDLADYMSFVRRWRHLFSVYSNLDVIGDAAGTAANQAAMEAEGLAPLPVFHTGEPWDVLEGLIDRYPYIALGGMVGKRKQALMPWCVKAFRMAEGRAVFHGFGLTTWDMLADLPWYSVDSSSWGSGYRYGIVRLWDPDARRIRQFQLSDHTNIYQDRGAKLIRLYGYDPADFTVKARYSRAKMAGLSAVSWMAAAQALRDRHGPIMIPDRPGLPGLHTYSADANMDNLGLGHAGVNLYMADGSMANSAAGQAGVNLYIADTNLNDLGIGHEALAAYQKGNP